MTKAEQIRAMAGKPAKEVAKQVGCSVRHVNRIWQIDRDPAAAARAKQWTTRYLRLRGHKPRDQWIADMRENSRWKAKDAKLVAMVKEGVRRKDIADKLGETKNSVIGRWHRLVELGLA